MSTGKTTLLVCLFMSLFISMVSGGTRYYVATDGDDNDANGLTPQTPFRTIRKAANTISPGDDVEIKGGTYNEGYLKIPTGGTENDPTIFQPYNNEEVIISPGVIYNTWTQNPNGIYTIEIPNFNKNIDSQGFSYGALIKKGGHAIKRVKTYDELFNPVFGEDVTNPNAYDLFYADSNDFIYLKLVSGGNPNTDIVVLAEAYKAIYFGEGSYGAVEYIEFRDLKIRYSNEAIRAYHYSKHIKIINCEIEHITRFGILTIADSSVNDHYFTIKGNYFSHMGIPLKYNSSDELVLNNLDHALYLTGKYYDVSDNYMTKCIGGTIMHPWSSNSSFPQNCCIYNNYIDGGFVGSGTNNKVYNNIILNTATGAGKFGLNVSYPSTGYEIFNNLIDSYRGVAISRADNLTYKNNIVMAAPDNYACYIANSSDLSIDNNIYCNGKFYVNGTDISTFPLYQSAVSSYGWEQNSKYGDPNFINDENGDYHLAPSSPCIDAGDPNEPTDLDSYNPYAPNETDFDRLNRIHNGVVDMGPYEYSPRVINISKNTIYDMIQDAIDYADDFDEIVVYPGTYYERINFLGKPITVRSVDPNDWNIVAATIVDANDLTYGTASVTFDSNEGVDSVLSGFTLTGGDYGVLIEGDYPEIPCPIVKKCIIENTGRIAIRVTHALPVIEYNIIRNIPQWALYVEQYGEPGVYNNLFHSNSEAMKFTGESQGEIFNNTIVNNKIGISTQNGTPEIKNCILWDNTSFDLGAGCTASYSCIEDAFNSSDPNFIGSIGDDPNFVDAANDDFHLLANSPCIDAGDPNGVYTGQIDIDGDSRVIGSNIDMGADEVVQ